VSDVIWLIFCDLEELFVIIQADCSVNRRIKTAFEHIPQVTLLYYLLEAILILTKRDQHFLTVGMERRCRQFLQQFAGLVSKERTDRIAHLFVSGVVRWPLVQGEWF